MEKDRSTKVIAIVALLIGVVGLTVGFAAMSSTLTISSSADVTPDENDFTVQFSTTANTITGTTVEGSTSPSNVANFTAEDATINNGTKSSTISGLEAHFTEPGQTVTYTFHAVNGGKYTAYLNNVVFGKATGATGNEFKVCNAGENTTERTVNGGSGLTGACAGINLKISIGTMSNLTPESTDLDAISNHSLAPFGTAGNSEEIVVTITYAEGSERADGDFDVKFGDITLTYDAVD